MFPNEKTNNKFPLTATCHASFHFEYRKIPKISPGAYLFYFILFFFLGGGGRAGGAYVRREICLSKSIGLAL